jgi:hypothetical protein
MFEDEMILLHKKTEDEKFVKVAADSKTAVAVISSNKHSEESQVLYGAAPQSNA